MSAEQQQPGAQPVRPAVIYGGAYPSAYPSVYPGTYPVAGFPSYYPSAAPVTSSVVYPRAVIGAPTTVVASTAPVAAPVYGSYYPGAPVTSAAPIGFGSYYGGHPGQVPVPPQGPEFNRGYFYDDYIHDRHSPRRSYAGFRPANAPIYEGDIIYRKAIRHEEDFVLPRRSPSHATQSQAPTSSAAPAAAAAAPAEAAAPAPATRSFGVPTIEVVEAKDLPTSILDKNDVFVVLKVAGQSFQTRCIDNAGKAARWNETFTVNGLRSGSEGTISVNDKDKFTSNDALGTATFFVENGDRWFSLKPKGQVRLNISNCQ